MYNNKNVHKMLNRDDSDLLSKKKKHNEGFTEEMKLLMSGKKKHKWGRQWEGYI